MPDALSFELHKLTARLDRVADVLLREAEGISYSRFLALLAIRESGGTQRDVATWLGLSEPSTSRMVGLLAEAGLVAVDRVAGTGNRRRLGLTEEGARVVTDGGRLLEESFAGLVARSGVSMAALRRHTRRLLAQLDADRETAGRKAAS